MKPVVKRAEYAKRLNPVSRKCRRSTGTETSAENKVSVTVVERILALESIKNVKDVETKTIRQRPDATHCCAYKKASALNARVP